MARGKDRKRRITERRPGTSTKAPPMSHARTFELGLAKAREEQNPRVALALFQAALDACQHIAAVSVFEGEANRLWDLPDGRLYLEALFGTASSLRHLDRREAAADRFRELLQLDSSDQQFACYWLTASLFDLERHDELKQLLERYEEPTAVWRYAQALLAFRLGGDTDDAQRLLQEARQLDAGFLDYSPSSVCL